MAKRISIINFKGGVGKTTLAFQFATGLVRFHKPCRVLLIDMDHQSSLSIVCLDAVEWEKAVADKKTTTEIIKPFISRSKMPGREIIIQDPLSNKDYERMDLVPASLQLDDAEIELTASHHGNAIQSEWDKRTLVCRWIEETGVNDEYDYIIFDCPPATKIGLLDVPSGFGRRLKGALKPEGRIEAFHAVVGGLDAAWGAERWKRGRYSRSGLA